MKEYNIENYTNPRTSYKRISNKLKLGQLIYDIIDKKIKIVDIHLLGEILEFEQNISDKCERRYFTIPLTKEWLEKVFDFNSKYNAANSMTVFTSQRHGLKIHKQNSGFYIALISREKTSVYGMSGTIRSKPKILFVNELMDYLYLLKRDEIIFTENEIKKINEIIKVQ